MLLVSSAFGINANDAHAANVLASGPQNDCVFTIYDDYLMEIIPSDGSSCILKKDYSAYYYRGWGWQQEKTIEMALFRNSVVEVRIAEGVKLNGDIGNMLSDAKALKALNSANWDTAEVTNINNLFSRSSAIEHLDLSNWDTSKITNLGSTFYMMSSLQTLDLSNWDTSNVESMFWTFNGATNLWKITYGNKFTWKKENLNRHAPVSPTATQDLTGNWAAIQDGDFIGDTLATTTATGATYLASELPSNPDGTTTFVWQKTSATLL